MNGKILVLLFLLFFFPLLSFGMFNGYGSGMPNQFKLDYLDRNGIADESCVTFFITDNAAITAGHCISTAHPMQIRRISPINYFKYDGTFVGDTSYVFDLAILIFPDGTASKLGLSPENYFRLSLESHSLPSEGLVFSFPHINKDVIDFSKRTSGKFLINNFGHSMLCSENENFKESLPQIYEGDSGAPFVNTHSLELTGVATSGKLARKKTCFTPIHTKQFQELLRYAVEFGCPPNSNTPDRYNDFIRLELPDALRGAPSSMRLVSNNPAEEISNIGFH